MQLMVHFVVGMVMGLLVLTVVDLPPQREFLLLIGSGVWGTLPDAHWILLSAGFVDAAAAGKAFHRSAWSNLFWFHHALDQYETGRTVLEGGVALGVLLLVAVGYAHLNDWSIE